MHEHINDSNKAAAIRPWSGTVVGSRAFRCLQSTALLWGVSAAIVAVGCGSSGGGNVPSAIRAIMNKSQYSGATWALRVVDLKSGKLIYDLNSQDVLLTGSVRKLYSVGEALNKLGSDHRFTTPVYRAGTVDGSGNLNGNLILVANGDLTMGGRDNGDDTIAITDFDHCDANSLGGAILTTPDPLAGLNKLAAQVRASGITKISGDVIIDDRLFQEFRVPNQHLMISPIIVNDNLIDVTILPTQPGQPAQVEWRPQTTAFNVTSTVTTTAAGSQTDVTLTRTGPYTGTVSGEIAADYTSPLPGVKTLVQTFRVDDPVSENNLTPFQESAAFARTTFVEALNRAGVTVTAPALGPNASSQLPPSNSYSAANQVATLVSAPYAQYAKLILKISHNLGANLSLMLFGLANGQNTIQNSLAKERTTLTSQYGLNGAGFMFPTNGSGSPDSRASATTTVNLLTYMSQQAIFPDYFAGLPILGTDGSLAEIGTDSPAKGKVFAKTGTYLDHGKIGAQVLAGYINAQSGRQLAYALYVNNAGAISNIGDLINVIQDEGHISTIIQQSN